MNGSSQQLNCNFPRQRLVTVKPLERRCSLTAEFFRRHRFGFGNGDALFDPLYCKDILFVSAAGCHQHPDKCTFCQFSVAAEDKSVFCRDSTVNIQGHKQRRSFFLLNF